MRKKDLVIIYEPPIPRTFDPAGIIIADHETFSDISNKSVNPNQMTCFNYYCEGDHEFFLMGTQVGELIIYDLKADDSSRHTIHTDRIFGGIDCVWMHRFYERRFVICGTYGMIGCMELKSDGSFEECTEERAHVINDSIEKTAVYDGRSLSDSTICIVWEESVGICGFESGSVAKIFKEHDGYIGVVHQLKNQNVIVVGCDPDKNDFILHFYDWKTLTHIASTKATDDAFKDILYKDKETKSDVEQNVDYIDSLVLHGQEFLVCNLGITLGIFDMTDVKNLRLLRRFEAMEATRLLRIGSFVHPSQKHIFLGAARGDDDYYIRRVGKGNYMYVLNTEDLSLVEKVEYSVDRGNDVIKEDEDDSYWRIRDFGVCLKLVKNDTVFCAVNSFFVIRWKLRKEYCINVDKDEIERVDYLVRREDSEYLDFKIKFWNDEDLYINKVLLFSS